MGGGQVVQKVVVYSKKSESHGPDFSVFLNG